MTFVDVPERPSTQFLPIAPNVLEERWETLGLVIHTTIKLYLERDYIESVGVHGGGR